MAKKRPAYGSYVWLDIVSKRPRATQAFFQDVFGWKMTADPR
jgi:predicted enzyme related to lactoylglutathione lyase